MRLPFRRSRASETAGDWYLCGQCGERHEGLAFAFAFGAPLAWEQLSPADRGSDSVLEDEICVIHGSQYFVRGLIEIDVVDAGTRFAWNVWSSLSAANFERALSIWSRPARVNETPYFGTLSNDLTPAYRSALNLKVKVHTRELGSRPYIEVELTNHPLAIEQRHGISLERVREINALIRHHAPPGLEEG